MIPECITLQSPSQLAGKGAMRFYACCTYEEAVRLFEQTYGYKPAVAYTFSCTPTGMIFALGIDETCEG
jgi:hypothetical protein